MKNLKEIWSGIRLDAELIKQNYNAELLGIGVHGMTRLAVKLEDADLEFIQGSLKELYVSENDKIIQLDLSFELQKRMKREITKLIIW